MEDSYFIIANLSLSAISFTLALWAIKEGDSDFAKKAFFWSFVMILFGVIIVALVALILIFIGIGTLSEKIIDELCDYFKKKKDEKRRSNSR
jgi:hypothetical protein